MSLTPDEENFVRGKKAEGDAGAFMLVVVILAYAIYKIVQYFGLWQ